MGGFSRPLQRLGLAENQNEGGHVDPSEDRAKTESRGSSRECVVTVEATEVNATHV
jgi:hypothetical protein